jgi:hypothetical protein
MQEKRRASSHSAVLVTWNDDVACTHDDARWRLRGFDASW